MTIRAIPRCTRLTAAQCRAARGLLGLSQEALAAAASVGVSTLIRFESKPDDVATRPVMVAAIEAALSKAGIILIEEAVIEGMLVRSGVALSSKSPDD